MKKNLIILISFFCFNSVFALTTNENVVFSKCVDGDTAYFTINDKEEKFRFLAIDTPETVHPTIKEELYGKDASEFTCNSLTNAKEIIVEYEESNKVDKYGRKLAWIWVDGKLLQNELIKIGYAQVAYIYGDYRYTESLCLNQKNSKDSKIGLWNDDVQEGYCSTIDLATVKDNINYDEINNNQKTSNNKTIDKLTKAEEKVSNFLEENENSIYNIYFYGFLILAFTVMMIKEFKKK